MTATSDGEKAEYGQRAFQTPTGATEILLVRHGQSAPYREGEPFPLVDGQGDPPLSPLGEWQAEQVGERLSGVEIDAIYVTTLQRTHQTAAPLAARLGLEPRLEAGPAGGPPGGVGGRRLPCHGRPGPSGADRDELAAGLGRHPRRRALGGPPGPCAVGDRAHPRHATPGSGWWR